MCPAGPAPRFIARAAEPPAEGEPAPAAVEDVVEVVEHVDRGDERGDERAPRRFGEQKPDFKVGGMHGCT